MRLDKGYNSVDLQNRLDPEDLKSHFTSWISRLTGLVAQCLVGLPEPFYRTTAVRTHDEGRCLRGRRCGACHYPVALVQLKHERSSPDKKPAYLGRLARA